MRYQGPGVTIALRIACCIATDHGIEVCAPKALGVGLCLWRLAGAMKSKTVKLSTSETESLGIDRHAKARALRQLENAGLVDVVHRQGRFPRVTIKDATTR